MYLLIRKKAVSVLFLGFTWLLAIAAAAHADELAPRASLFESATARDPWRVTWQPLDAPPQPHTAWVLMRLR
jgi:hypothetical protein